MIVILGIASSCKKQEDVQPSSVIVNPVDDYNELVPGKTWCKGPSDTALYLKRQNSYVLLVPEAEYVYRKIQWIDGEDTITFTPVLDNIQVGRKFYCEGDYDTFQWKYTDTDGNNWTEWRTDTIRYNQKTEIIY